MPFAVTHVLLTIIVVELIRDHFIKDNENFPLYLVLVGGIAGLFPDVDFIVFWFLHAFFNFSLGSVHQMITHSVLWPGAFLVATIGAYISKHKKLTYWLLVIAIGLTMHLILDILCGYIPALAPFFHNEVGFNFLPNTELGRSAALGVDALLLLCWLIYLEWRHKISKFI